MDGLVVQPHRQNFLVFYTQSLEAPVSPSRLSSFLFYFLQLPTSALDRFSQQLLDFYNGAALQTFALEMNASSNQMLPFGIITDHQVDGG